MKLKLKEQPKTSKPFVVSNKVLYSDVYDNHIVFEKIKCVVDYEHGKGEKDSNLLNPIAFFASKEEAEDFAYHYNDCFQCENVEYIVASIRLI